MAALVPSHREPPTRALIDGVHREVGRVLLVDDGSPRAAAERLRELARDTASELLRLPVNAGKGCAIAAGLRHLLASSPAPTAVVVVDADGQHLPEAIPSFLVAAAESELVIGDRFHDLAAMPAIRRATNRTASALLSVALRRRVRDTQCGMRLLHGRALVDVPFPEGGYEAETVHLKRCVRAGVRVGWVRIPTVYGEEESSFRALRDSARVLRALVS